ncbi:hypothetical protein L204_105276 [Cryptococcus depauperatus]|nr:hypothetical protein L204_06337 [Cryptococcus depauperatus CBS 7855]
MPRHVPTFKHLLHTSQSQRRQQPEQTERPRRRRIVRDIPPYILGQNVWSPNTAGGVDADLLVDLDKGGIHPAELLRRFEHSRWLASQTTAGPAEPPSWHAARKFAALKSQRMKRQLIEYPLVTTLQLEAVSAFFSHHPKIRARPISRLTDCCLYTIIQNIDNGTIIYEPDDRKEEAINQEDETYTIGRLLREQVNYLDQHLKQDLLDAESLLPEDYPRISDESYCAILCDQLPLEHCDDGKEAVEDWEDCSTTDFVNFTHLPLTLHPDPSQLLRRIPFVSSLLSINLAYSTIADLGNLVEVLPKSVQELGFAGVRMEKQGEDTIKKGLIRLARKLLVLKTLDLSNPRYPLSTSMLEATLHPAETNFPSLRRIGLQGVLDQLYSKTKSLPTSKKDGQEKVIETREGLKHIVRSERSIQYVEIVWE